MAIVPTKGNLIATKNSLELSRTGYELLDKKRNILVRELMALVDTAKNIQQTIDTIFAQAYSALERANIETGIDEVEKISYAINIEDRVQVRFRSVMGVEIPIVNIPKEDIKPVYSLLNTSYSLDIARKNFDKVVQLSCLLAQIENSIFRLAENIRKTQKRANALKNIMIPRYEEEAKLIQNYLEEKEREEFSRLKVIKKQKKY